MDFIPLKSAYLNNWDNTTGTRSCWLDRNMFWSLSSWSAAPGERSMKGWFGKSWKQTARAALVAWDLLLQVETSLFTTLITTRVIVVMFRIMFNILHFLQEGVSWPFPCSPPSSPNLEPLLLSPSIASSREKLASTPLWQTPCSLTASIVNATKYSVA